MADIFYDFQFAKIHFLFHIAGKNRDKITKTRIISPKVNRKKREPPRSATPPQAGIARYFRHQPKTIVQCCIKDPVVRSKK